MICVVVNVVVTLVTGLVGVAGDRGRGYSRVVVEVVERRG